MSVLDTIKSEASLFTGMIEEVETRRLIVPEVQPVEADDIRVPGPDSKFDGRAAANGSEVFKRIDPAAPDAVPGLLACRRCGNYVE
jgi:hypothetical protein